MSNPIIICRGVSKTFHQGNVPVEVLKGVDLQVDEGEAIAIVGQSGSGKSTLLHILGGLDAPTTGEVDVLGNRIDQLSPVEQGRLRNSALGFVYQFHHLLPEFTAEENIILPQMAANVARSVAATRARALLGSFGLAGRETHRPGKLSGGEQQRVAIARALANAPRILLADEPTGNLDVATAARVFAELMQAVRGQGVAALVATHNPELARQMDRVVTLRDGKITAA